MSQTTLQLGFVPKERGEYTSGATYYKDNVVQCNGSSYIADPVGWSELHPTDTYVTIAPTDASGNLNVGWRVFASCNNKFTTGESVDNIGIDDEPTAGSDNLVKSGGVQNELALGAVYDVSAKNPTAGPNSDGKWESLSALLSDANLNTLIPSAVRKGGMSIKFVQSSDNNYVQWRLVSKDWSTDTNNWVAENEDFRNKVMQDVNNAIASIQPIEIIGDVTNAPDEEDLTSVNVGGTDVLKFKDRAYNPLTYSGLGRVYLRKNIVNGVNTITQDMFYKGEVGSREPNTNTIFVIQYDYVIDSANDNTITIPENCVLEFDGGSLKNGILVETNTLRVINGTFNGVEIHATDCNILELYDSVFKNNKQNGIKAIHTKVIAMNCSFVDIGSESSNVISGIFAYGDCTGTYIVNCLFKNIIASSNATGVHFGLRDDKVTFGFTVKDCIFDNINGISDDGDGIKVIYGINGENYDIASSIANCKFYNCSKRAIKIQSRGVRVENVYIEGGCSFASVDFQRGNAYIDGLIANNVNGRIGVDKLTGFNYINNVDYNFREDDNRYNCFITISSSADDYTSGNSIILSNLKCNKITSLSYSNIKLDCEDYAANIQNIVLSNIKGFKTGSYNPFIEFFGTCTIDYLEVNSLTFYNPDSSFLKIRAGVAVKYANIFVNGNIIVNSTNRALGFSSYKINGLYSSTPKTNVAIYNGKAVFTSTVNSIALLASSEFKSLITVGDKACINNATYLCVGAVSESYPNGEWVLINDIKEKGLEGIIRVGTTTNRPKGIGASGGKLSPARDLGFEYFDTTLGLPIYAKAIESDGTVTWVKADGTNPDVA